MISHPAIRNPFPIVITSLEQAEQAATSEFICSFIDYARARGLPEDYFKEVRPDISHPQKIDTMGVEAYAAPFCEEDSRKKEVYIEVAVFPNGKCELKPFIRNAFVVCSCVKKID